VRQPFQLPPLERAAQLALAITVVVFVFGSSSVADLNVQGHKLRWACLIGLAFVALAWAASRRRADLPWSPFAAVGAIAGLALISTLWSVRPRLTFERASSLTIVLVIAGALAFAAAGRAASVERLLDAVLAAASLVALAGIGLWVVSPNTAVIAADEGNPSRFRGLGENPNTVPMLFAVALPLATLLVLDGRRPRRRAVGLAAFLLLEGSIVASGSRGALVSAVGAVAFVAVVTLTSWPRRIGAVVIVGAVFLVSVGIMEIPKPLPPATTAPPATSQPASKPAPSSQYLDAQLLLRLEDDIGHPPYGSTAPTYHRHFLGTSGRIEAWRGAIKQALQRPIAGYGFGTESKVFVDRYVTFYGGLPENTYIGLFLQVGLAGLVAFALAILALARIAWQRLPELSRESRARTVAAGGMLVAGLLLGLGQSYIYSVGNVATLSVWVGALLVVAAAVPEKVSS
jgi:O-antigen ligase